MENKKPDIDLVKKFLNGDCTNYDFKKQHDSLCSIVDPIQRFLEYKLNYLRHSNFDADCCDLTMSIQCILLRYKLNLEDVTYNGRKIYYVDREGTDTVLETDTINSFASIYKGALKTAMKDDYSKACENCGMNMKKGLFDKVNFPKFAANRDQFDLKKYNPELDKVFREFAESTHFIGNFNIGPEGFNIAKANSVRTNWNEADRFDLFIENMTRYCEWFTDERNIELSYMEEYFENGKPVDLGCENPIDVTAIAKRVERIDKLIKNRSERMINDLRKAVENYC